jgi:hypothetical protein
VLRQVAAPPSSFYLTARGRSGNPIQLDPPGNQPGVVAKSLTCQRQLV